MDATQVQNNNSIQIVCPQCGGTNVTVQMFQEDAGTTTVSKTESKYKQKGHGLIWWLCVGSWWWIVDLFLWICVFPVKLIQTLTKKKKYKGKSTTVSQSVNQVKYKTICLCGNCGYSWVKNELTSNNLDSVKKDVKKLMKTVK